MKRELIYLSLEAEPYGPSINNPPVCDISPISDADYNKYTYVYRTACIHIHLRNRVHLRERVYRSSGQEHRDWKLGGQEHRDWKLGSKKKAGQTGDYC